MNAFLFTGLVLVDYAIKIGMKEASLIR